MGSRSKTRKRESTKRVTWLAADAAFCLSRKRYFLEDGEYSMVCDEGDAGPKQNQVTYNNMCNMYMHM